MNTVIIDTVIKDNIIKIPQKFKSKHVRIIITDLSNNSQKNNLDPQKINFKINKKMKDVIPFSDVEDTAEFAKQLREKNLR